MITYTAFMLKLKLQFLFIALLTLSCSQYLSFLTYEQIKYLLLILALYLFKKPAWHEAT